MNTINLFSCFGDIIELGFPKWNIDRTFEVLNNHDSWKQYNPRKSIKRFGLSVTSLDGGFSGIPDLDSVLEYNKEFGTSLAEKDFNKQTPIVDQITELQSLLSIFGSAVGRSHFLRLDAGGFFPPHRDNGRDTPSKTIRIIVPLIPIGKKQIKWIHDGSLVSLDPGVAYCINTSKEHSLFSFMDNSTMLVLNITSTPISVQTIVNNMAVK